ncbi:hypothetical protein ACJ73_08257 [Blastomyces percursus]|uniref:Uncharacterized protein n=1 Tax=Blastomyces percursus TaxID=1658174 RepID=A0A1J9QYL6_9EURO|nr:hypothetical protein ACJ73_08257 [Blastomyces percursus]
MMGNARTKKNDPQQTGGFEQSSSRPLADISPATVPTSASQPAPLRLSPIDPSRAQAPDRRLPPLFPRPGPMTQPTPNDSNAYNTSEIFPIMRPTNSTVSVPPAVSGKPTVPRPMLKLIIPNTARPSRPYGSETPWQGINMLTDPAFRDLQQPIAKILSTADQVIRKDDGLGLRGYLSLIADLDWDRVRQRQCQQHRTQPDQQHQQQQQEEARLQQAGQQQLPPSGSPGKPMLITVSRPAFPPPNSAVADNARRAYLPQFTTIQLLDGLYTRCEAVMNAIQKVNVGDGDKGPVELSLAELEGVVSSAKGLTLSLNGTMEHHAIGEVWAKCLQSRYP